MSPEAQRIAIAEVCPKVIHQINGDDFYVPSAGNYTSRRCYDNSVLSDLNAMHEAEKTLTEYEAAQYALRLHQHSSRVVGDYLGRDFDCLHATAAQRAEAFLRTVGKWED